MDPEQASPSLAEAIAMEGEEIDPEDNAIVGRWAGDKVYLVGDYDSSELYQESYSYRNISRELAEAWNAFIEKKDMLLNYNAHCECETDAKDNE